jgi:hypothetical protein
VTLEQALVEEKTKNKELQLAIQRLTEQIKVLTH